MNYPPTLEMLGKGADCILQFDLRESRREVEYTHQLTEWKRSRFFDFSISWSFQLQSFW